MGTGLREKQRLAAALLPLVLLSGLLPSLSWAQVSAQGSPAPQTEETTAAKAERPRLFGTVDFRRPLNKQKNWLSVLKRNAQSPIFFDENRLNRSTTWNELKARAQGRPLKEKLDVVNRFWNSWPYRIDREIWGKEDHWATPAEFLRHSGDCEDYCIAKYFTLRELGIPADQMRIVIVRETIRDIAHAILAVYDGQQVHILDNLSSHVRPMRRVRNYQPHFSVNENGRWMHVKAKPARK